MRLKLSLENGLFVRKMELTTDGSSLQDIYEGDFSSYKSNYKVEYALKKLQPHSFFLFNNEPLLLFFDFPKQIDEDKRIQLSRDIWNFNKSALVFINEPAELKIHNGFKYEESGLLQVLEVIKTIKDKHKLENYSYWKIVSAELWNLKDENFKKKTRVDSILLDNIKTAREILISKEKSERGLSEKHANRVIGRLIFVRYLIDRNINLDYSGEGRELLTKEKLPQLILQKDNLYIFFEYLLTRFKGDILPLNGEQTEIQPYHLSVLSNLFAGDHIKSMQRSFFNVFDFDFIPIELISNIYETFLGERQDTDKAFYTPPFLVDYVIEQTVKPFVEKQNLSHEISCKIIDFTCGSGIFLCEALRTILNKYIELENPDKSSNKFKNKIKDIVKENIFGNDVNQEAIEIAKFSLFITLLDYFEDPKDIEGFEFPAISENFYNYDVFDDTLDEIFGQDKLIQADFIIGNPPWGKVKHSRYLEYIKEREIKEYDLNRKSWLEKNKTVKEFSPAYTGISNKEFAQAFLLRLSDFSAPNTECHVIVTSKLLYNLQANKFRNYFLNNFIISEVLEISSVRHQIFANAVGPAAILKYKYAFDNNTSENVIDYVSLKPNPYFAIFKTILIEKYDYKEIIQKELIENDWLWKVLVYGHILDYKFIKRLRDKKSFPTSFKDIITIPRKQRKDNDLLFIGKGVSLGNKSQDCSNLLGIPFINTDDHNKKSKSQISKFEIDFSIISTWNYEKAERPRNPELFKAPILLIKSGLNRNFEIETAISHIDITFTNSLLAVKSYEIENNQLLYSLCGLFNSILHTFFLFQNGSSTGVEREQRFDKELFPFPLRYNEEVVKFVNDIIIYKRLISIYSKKVFYDDDKIGQFKKQLNKIEANLNDAIFKLYELTQTEKDLISYSQEITIPILQAKNKLFREIKEDVKLFRPFKKVKDTEIIDYIDIFKESFSKFHNGEKNGYINARIFQSENILAIEFYIESKQTENIRVDEPENEKILELVAGIGFQKISNDLFVQKDIKTLKSNSFSVIKINQYKYWHKAIAHLDVIEFSEAMLQSQIQVHND
jgi:hypothetical protein